MVNELDFWFEQGLKVLNRELEAGMLTTKEYEVRVKELKGDYNNEYVKRYSTDY